MKKCLDLAWLRWGDRCQRSRISRIRRREFIINEVRENEIDCRKPIVDATVHNGVGQQGRGLCVVSDLAPLAPGFLVQYCYVLPYSNSSVHPSQNRNMSYRSTFPVDLHIYYRGLRILIILVDFLSLYVSRIQKRWDICMISNTSSAIQYNTVLYCKYE